MTAAPPETVRRRRWERRRSSLQRQPQWWLTAVAVIGWLVLAGLFVAAQLAPATTAGHGGHAGHDHGAGATVAGVAPHVAAGIAMVAVMLPLIAVNVRYAALRSPRRARGAVTVDVVAGWTLVWVGAALALGVAAWLLANGIGSLAAIGLVTVVAIGWQFTLRKRLSLARCDALLAPPLNRRDSRRACRRYGVSLGLNCVQSCWPLMALMAVAAHNPLVVAALMGVGWYERQRRPHHDPGTRTTSLAIAVTGAAAIAATHLLVPT